MEPADRSDPRPRRVPTWLRVLIPTVLILLWFGAFGAGGASFGALSDVVENEQSQFLPAEAESTRVQDLQAEFRSADVIPAIVVYARDGGLTDEDTAAIEDDAAAFEINVPMNSVLQKVDLGTSDESSRSRARTDFEARWNRWNAIRTGCSGVASILLLMLLLRV
jgi:uncharacterized membrane protein YdfJ with MMPL/SSD domain